MFNMPKKLYIVFDNRPGGSCIGYVYNTPPRGYIYPDSILLEIPVETETVVRFVPGKPMFVQEFTKES